MNVRIPLPEAKPSGSRWLHGADRLTARPGVAVLVVVADALWVLFSITVGFPARLETIFQTLVAALTLAMVFVIQHTQGHTNAATQRKLDELLRALPDADNTYVSLEHGSPHDLKQAADTHLQIRTDAIDPSPPTPTAGESDR